ncbi:MAG: C40 family peptidase [Mycobacteriales bacterium]
MTRLARTPRRLASLVALLGALGASGLAATGGSASPAPPDEAARRVIIAARQQLGDRYVWAGVGPDEWDCSGLTSVMWRTSGGVRAIPRTSAQQQAWVVALDPAEALPGDLVFFGDPVTHVGLYLGGGKMIDASSSRGQVTERAVWTEAVVRYGRVPRATAPAAHRAKPAATPQPQQQGKATTPPRSTALRPVPPLGHKPRTRARTIGMRFVRGARSMRGARYERGADGPRFDAAGLVRWAWLKAGGDELGTTPRGIAAVAVPVPLRDLTAGDLVIYGDPANHIGIYVGGGMMIDTNAALGRVTQRRVFATSTVRFARLP